MGFNPGFYNAPSRAVHGIKARMGQKSLVGSYNVGRTPVGKASPHQPAGMGRLTDVGRGLRARCDGTLTRCDEV